MMGIENQRSSRRKPPRWKEIVAATASNPAPICRHHMEPWTSEAVAVFQAARRGSARVGLNHRRTADRSPVLKPTCPSTSTLGAEASRVGIGRALGHRRHANSATGIACDRPSHDLGVVQFAWHNRVERFQ
jgi:hypothetical protein